MLTAIWSSLQISSQSEETFDFHHVTPPSVIMGDYIAHLSLPFQARKCANSKQCCDAMCRIWYIQTLKKSRTRHHDSVRPAVTVFYSSSLVFSLSRVNGGGWSRA